MTDTDGRWMGLDVGEVRIGVAISDESKILAQPLSLVQRAKSNKYFDEILRIASQNSVERIVVGIPLDQAGDEGPMALRILEFIDQLTSRTSIPVTRWDERFSTLQAQRALREAGMRRKKRRALVDKTAAALILQNYIDAQRGGVVNPDLYDLWPKENNHNDEA